MNHLSIKNGKITDNRGFTVYLRGINFIPDQSFNKLFSDKKSSAAHLKRIRDWGFNLVRIPVFWSQLEPKQGKYDIAYIKKLQSILQLAEKENLYTTLVFCWNQENYPPWLAEKAGMDPAILHHAEKDAILRQFIALFFPTALLGGKTFFPKLQFGGKNIQDLLTAAFTASILKLLSHLKKHKNLSGLDLFNGLHHSFIGLGMTEAISPDTGVAATPTPFQLISYAAGNAVQIPVSVIIKTHGFTVWKKYFHARPTIWKDSCIFARHNIWETDPNGAPILVNRDYFSKQHHKKIHFQRDFLLPFQESIAKKVNPHGKYILEYCLPSPTPHPGFNFLPAEQFRDHSTGIAGRWHEHIFVKQNGGLIFGKNRIAASLYAAYRKHSARVLLSSGSPLFVSNLQTGLDFKNSKTSREMTRMQSNALQRIIQPLEKNFLSFAIGNYSAENSPSSLYVPALLGITDNGGRGVPGFSRPYIQRTNATPVSMSFDWEKGLFKLSIRKNSDIPVCEIFMPPIHYKNGFKIQLNAGKTVFFPRENKLVFSGEKGINLYGISILIG